VHAPVELDHNARPLAQKPREEPHHQSVAPVRRACERNVLCASGPTNFAERGLDELLRVRDKRRWLADLGHGRCDEVRLYALDVYPVRLEFRTKSRGPLLKEGLAAGVGGEEGGREEPTKRCHGEDETALARDHAWGKELSNAEGGHAVDHDDVVHLLLGRLDERYGDAMAQSDVVDQNADVQSVDQLLQFVIVGIFVQRKVHCQRLGRDLGAIFRGDVGGEGVELGLRAGDEDEVVALCGQGEGELLADAVRGTGYESPGAAGSVRVELDER
jgi:hypothetical protein